jgi:hypothetical protein
MIARSRYSPKVALALKIGGREVALSHVGPREITIREACEFVPPSAAELVISVDDEVESYSIFLPHGLPHAPQKVAYL